MRHLCHIVRDKSRFTFDKDAMGKKNKSLPMTPLLKVSIKDNINKNKMSKKIFVS